jgi:hypothetical protein
MRTIHRKLKQIPDLKLESWRGVWNHLELVQALSLAVLEGVISQRIGVGSGVMT